MTTKVTYAKATLEATPYRALALLRGIHKNASIRAILLTVGFTREDATEGWELLHACTVAPGTDIEDLGIDVAEALRELDEWDERGFALVRATLTHRYPPQASFLMSGLEPAAGPEAVDGVARLLDRLDAFENDPLREELRDDDQAALAFLETRGLGREQRQRLRALVRTVQRATGSSSNSTRTEEGEELARLTRLRAWYDEWSELARVLIQKPAYLEQLGLAGRRAEAV
ncbi:MAG: hypothetical protein HOW73_50245 [Polyangiaceae bacterium]|nr:hypothetical protein [Polyangiaceae bacterium]